MLLGLRPDWQIPGGHFCPATPSSGDRTLHLYYSLLNLQKEIEKRTFYLGKYRRPVDENGNEGAVPHLLDLIGMSRDEADILYPFAKSAMADVFDALNHATVGLPKEYRWEDKKNVLGIKRRLKPTTTISAPSSLTVVARGDKLLLSGTIDLGTLGTANGEITEDMVIKDTARPNLNVTVKYYTKRQVIATGEWISIEHNDAITIDKSGIFAAQKDTNDSNKYKNTVSYMYSLQLASQDGTHTAEVIDLTTDPATVSGSLSLATYWEFTNPQVVAIGQHFTVDNATSSSTEYEADSDFNQNDLTTDDSILLVGHAIVEADNFMEEGIHYFISFPNYLNDSLIEPLDTAIIEALVNRIIWKWLLLAFPNEAAVYDTLYQDSIRSLRTRCDIFQKHWVSRTPRML